MKAAVLHSPRDLRLEEIPFPVAGPGEVVVRVEAALMCGTDLKTWRRGHPFLPLPAVIGHELAGRVESIGDGVTGFRTGDRVVPAVSGPCGECTFCSRGKENLCGTAMEPGEKTWGAFAEAVVVPARVVRSNLYAIPDSLPSEVAALLDPLASVVHAWKRLPDPRGKCVLILGAGPLAFLHLLVAKKQGAGRVVVVGRRSSRLEKAKELGADEVLDTSIESLDENALDRMTQGSGAEIVVECAGTPEAWEEASGLAAPGATVCLFGGCAAGSRASFDTGRIHYQEISLVGSFHYTPADAKQAFDLIIEGKLAFAGILSGRFPLDRIQDVFDLHERGEGMKEIIVP